jgi:hypothetical protein
VLFRRNDDAGLAGGAKDGRNVDWFQVCRFTMRLS